MMRRSLFFLFLLLSPVFAEEPKILLKEAFNDELSKDWFWGLGTWKAENGVLRGFESGPRRHGPVKVRKLPLKDAVVECEFRLNGKATFAGIIFNGSQDRGHIVHLIMSKDQLRVMSHPKKGESKELLKVPAKLAIGEWHRVRLEFRGPVLTASIDGQNITAEHACIAEEKQTFGLGGDSGGPEGEKAGTLEFRNLIITAP
jgi:hypothetical protein